MLGNLKGVKEAGLVDLTRVEATEPWAEQRRERRGGHKEWARACMRHGTRTLGNTATFQTPRQRKLRQRQRLTRPSRPDREDTTKWAFRLTALMDILGIPRILMVVPSLPTPGNSSSTRLWHRHSNKHEMPRWLGPKV